MMLRQAPSHVLRAGIRQIRSWFGAQHTRLRMRRRLLLFSAPVAVLLLLAAAGALTVVMAGNLAVRSFNDHDVDGLRDAVERLRGLGVIDSGHIAYAEGDVAVLEGRLEDAEARFAESLHQTATDASCPVRINLELVRETLADIAVRAGRIDDADRLYTSAMAVVTEAPASCFAGNSDSIAERQAVLADTQPRLERKLDAIHQSPSTPPTLATVTPEPPPAPGAGQPGGPPAPALPPLGGAAPGAGAGPSPGQQEVPAPGQETGPGQQPGPGEGPGAGATAAQAPPLPNLPGENLPVPPPPPPPRAAGPGGPGDGPLPVAGPDIPDAPRILGPVGPDGLPLGDPNAAAPPERLNPGDEAPLDRLQVLLENANSYGGQRE